MGSSWCRCSWTWSVLVFFFFSSRRRHTRFDCDWSSDVCSSDLASKSASVMTEADFDAARAQLEQSLHQAIAQQLAAGAQSGEKLSDTIVFGPPQFTTDHQPNDKVPTFTGTMTVSGEGDFYTDADVVQAFKTYLSQRVPNDQQLLTESPIQITYRLLSAATDGYLV